MERKKREGKRPAGSRPAQKSTDEPLYRETYASLSFPSLRTQKAESVSHTGATQTMYIESYPAYLPCRAVVTDRPLSTCIYMYFMYFTFAYRYYGCICLICALYDTGTTRTGTRRVLGIFPLGELPELARFEVRPCSRCEILAFQDWNLIRPYSFPISGYE